MSRLGYELGLVVLIFGGFLFAGGGNDLSTTGGAVMAVGLALGIGGAFLNASRNQS
jgi:hypothetical protein